MNSSPVTSPLLQDVLDSEGDDGGLGLFALLPSELLLLLVDVLPAPARLPLALASASLFKSLPKSSRSVSGSEFILFCAKESAWELLQWAWAFPTRPPLPSKVPIGPHFLLPISLFFFPVR